MTLAEWKTRTGILPTHPMTERNPLRGVVSVLVPKVNPDRVALWHLADYAVSSVIGPVVWLVPKRVEPIDADDINDILGAFLASDWEACRGLIRSVRHRLNAGARIPNVWTSGAVHERLNYFETRIPDA